MGIQAFFILLLSASFFIWDITIHGNRMLSDDEITKVLMDQNVHTGIFKRSLDCDGLEEKLRSEIPLLTWVSAEIKGTRLIVHVKENDGISVEKEESFPCEIRAEKNGRITGIVVRDGIPLVKPGEEVEKGQILVSGVIPYRDDSGTVTATGVVAADAEIYACTRSEYEETVPAAVMVKALTGKKRSGFFLKAGRYSFRMMIPDHSHDSWIYETEERQMRLFKNFYLPIRAGIIRAYQYLPYERIPGRPEIEKRAGILKNEMEEKLKQKSIQILRNNVRIEEDRKNVRIIGTMDVIEDIAAAYPISERLKENNTIYEHH